MEKPRITISANIGRYELIAKTFENLEGAKAKKFMESVYEDMTDREVRELAEKYVEIIEKPRVEFDSKGPSGNIYHILGMVQHALKKQHRINDYNTLRDRVFDSKSYAEALKIVREYIDLIDIRGID